MVNKSRATFSIILGTLIIIDRLNDSEGVIKNHVILRENMPCGKVQYQIDVAGISRTIPKKDSAPGILMLAENILTIWIFCIKDVQRTAPNMEHAEFMNRKYSPMKDISRSYTVVVRNMVV